ncbi:MAG: hypothetical protein LBH58_11980 [Tannerellaceae bacterium]|nr:hypothetical protein [Tannerellaceae bacterium]
MTDLKRCPDKIKQAANGKKYINLCLAERKETGKYGETHTLFVSQTKEEREVGNEVVYVGSGVEFAPKPVTHQDINNAPVADNNDDLPF